MHRKREIRTNSNIEDWYFISGTLNVSDHCARPLKFKESAKQSSFLTGPKFFFEPLNSASLIDYLTTEEDEVVHNGLEITSNPFIVQNQ